MSTRARLPLALVATLLPSLIGCSQMAPRPRAPLASRAAATQRVAQLPPPPTRITRPGGSQAMATPSGSAATGSPAAGGSSAQTATYPAATYAGQAGATSQGDNAHSPGAVQQSAQRPVRRASYWDDLPQPTKPSTVQGDAGAAMQIRGQTPDPYGGGGYGAYPGGAGPGGAGPGGAGPGGVTGAPGGPDDPRVAQAPDQWITTNPYDTAAEIPLDIVLEEERTGRFIFGVGVNSDAGLTGQIIVDEQNFDWRAFPRSWDDVWNGYAWRGGGQRFRLEAMPGDRVQRYMASFTEPYLFDTMVSLSTSGSYFERAFFDWNEQRLGGRLALGYRLTPDLSVSGTFRGEEVTIFDPRVVGVPELDEVVGDNHLYGFKGRIAHDTRDVPFAPTEGHLLELSFEQVIGTFDYPRAELDYRQHFLVYQRPDGSGRHTLSYLFRVGATGAQTPVFENYYAGGFTTLRGFDFRGAAPVNGSVVVGGEFRFLGSVEYMVPLTADDMVRGVVFADFGTVEEDIEINPEDYRVAVGAGLRIAIPALGPAPLAIDFAIPLASEDTDDEQLISFFFGMGRS